MNGPVDPRSEAVIRLAEACALAPSPEHEVERLETELGRAYRALHAFYTVAITANPPANTAMRAYHCMTVGAAARFVNEGALDGSDYFEGKSVDVLAEALGKRNATEEVEALSPAPIIMVPVTSSNIEAIGYAPHTCTLVVDFHGGTRYRYANVPPDVYGAFKDSESKGRFFNQLIQPAFKAEPSP